ncbi:MAG TPA: hypothetical protein DEV93_01250 [Chloroflexi bacterium]|jgi:DNA polymerase-3 subunit beta|nr:hypothetical protein [Chloroflexota bacterium]
MQSRIGSVELIGALAAITRACGRQQSASFNPLVLVQLSPQRLSITRASIDTVARRTIPVDSDLTITFTLPAIPLHDLLQVVTGADLELDVEERTVRLRVGMFDTHLPKGKPDDFLMPAIDRGSTCVKVDGRQFAQAGSRVAFAKSDNENQPRLHGIFLDARDNEVIVAATDGHRAAEARTQATVLRSLERVIVPARPIAELGSILRVDGVSLDLVAPERTNWLRIESGDDYVQTQLIDGQYPNYSDVRPQVRLPGWRLTSTG